MRYPLSPQNGEGGRVSSLLSAWEGKSPKNKPRRTTVLPSEVRSKEKSRAKQSWRSAGQENTSVPAWRATSEKRSTVTKPWKASSSPYIQRDATSLSPGPRPNSPGRIASPGSASKALSAKSNDYIRKWQNIGSPDVDERSPEIFRSVQKETIGSSGPTTEVYRSQNEPDSPATLTMTYSVDSNIPPIKMSDTADSPSMNKLRSDLDTMSFLDYKSEPKADAKYQPTLHSDPNQEEAEEKKEEEEDDGNDEQSFYDVQHSMTSNSNASSSLVYSLEDTIPSVANSRKSKESIKSVMERLKQSASTSSQSSHDGTESGCSAQLIASDLVASTLAECRLLLQMSPPPTPITVNAFAQPRKEVTKVETKDEPNDLSIQAAPSTDTAMSDRSVDQLMRCPCCSNRFEEAGEHEPLHSFACEHIICKKCVFESTSNSVSCPECGEEGAFNKSKPLVSRSYLRLIKKMGDSSSMKEKKSDGRFKDSPMSVPSQINVGVNGKNAVDDVSVFSSISGQIHTNRLANRYRELAKQIDEESVDLKSTLSSQQQPPRSVKSSFTIHPKQDDVLSQMSESQCPPRHHYYPANKSNNSNVQEVDSVVSERLVASNNSYANTDNFEIDVNESPTIPPKEPSTPVSRAEYRFHQRKQRLAESLEKVNKVLAKSKNRNMGRICEEASVASTGCSIIEESAASVASSRVASSSVASSRVTSSSASSSREVRSSASSSTDASNSFSSYIKNSTLVLQDEDMTRSSRGSSKDTSISSLKSNDSASTNTEASRETKKRFKAQLRIDTGRQPSPLSVYAAQPSPTPKVKPQHSPIKEEPSPEQTPCESAKSEKTTVSNFDPFGDDPFADNVFCGNNVFRGDNAPVEGFGDFIRDATSSSDTEHENAFLLEKDTKYKPQPQPTNNGVQQLTEANRCAQFLPSLHVSKSGFIGMDSPIASETNTKITSKRVKKKQQQYSSAKPQKLSQKVFKSFSRSFDEVTNNTGGFSGNQDWRFQEKLPQPPSIESSDDDENQPPLYEFSEGSCSHSPSDSDDLKNSLSTLVTHKKGFRSKIRNKMKISKKKM